MPRGTYYDFRTSFQTVHIFHEPTATDRELIKSFCEPEDIDETPGPEPRLEMLSLEQAQDSRPEIHSTDVSRKTKLKQQSETPCVSSQRPNTSYLETDL